MPSSEVPLLSRTKAGSRQGSGGWASAAPGCCQARCRAFRLAVGGCAVGVVGRDEAVGSLRSRCLCRWPPSWMAGRSNGLAPCRASAQPQWSGGSILASTPACSLSRYSRFVPDSSSSGLSLAKSNEALPSPGCGDQDALRRALVVDAAEQAAHRAHRDRGLRVRGLAVRDREPSTARPGGARRGGCGGPGCVEWRSRGCG